MINYEYVKTKIDIDNLIKYSICQIYFGNRDWPENNMKIWRENINSQELTVEGETNGKWKWLLYNLDYSFLDYKDNTLQQATKKKYLDRFRVKNFNDILKPTKLSKILNKEESYVDWQENINKLIEFAEKRPTYIKQYLNEYFQ